ncbi:MAG: hypothetical protein COT81_03155 [Candidatus Buchananbacteria bacterium CG10_big_fil_rev_8_21_14_0_10_42_9]|uniref:SHSP domain-containing protein n=1 Tax=Candidatus Buchananbacteria bacterium CG10_big_fil_rev_8_21_14_0_10_42_9 TaxID=1974526 RepID=A0A2H0W193_9BACT|nr:MAG: hypothetical protein COT81_03155 [Candidatus Buchananbacteria bacterium CG10_big_fil_rev_8_21_14_0_10_42_9]
MKLTEILKKSKTKLSQRKASRKEMTEEFFSADLLIDLYVKHNNMIVKAAMAGVNPNNLDLAIDDNVLTISGYRENEETEEGGDYYYQECYWGGFSRSVALPYHTDLKKVSADIKDGILTITLPIHKDSKKIPVKSRGNNTELD